MAKKPTLKQELTKELQQLTKSLDEDGIRFLLEQALIIKHNQEVDQINQKITKHSKAKTTATKKTESIEIIAADDKKSFIFIINNNRKIVTQSEMRNMVRIAHQGNAAGLFTWLSKERRDILTDAGIRDKNHTLLTKIINIMKKNYKLKN
ncbi:MAG: hypothetical protein MJB14_09225 [Spirochaetes bacterium]|nr:hypothetical protein [Spirochaetota bacterium]